MDRVKIFFNQLKVLLKDVLQKYILTRFFGGVLTGFKGFLFGVIFKFAFEKLLVPLVDFLKRKTRVVINKIKLKKKVEEIKDAKTEDELADHFRDLP